MNDARPLKPTNLSELEEAVKVHLSQAAPPTQHVELEKMLFFYTLAMQAHGSVVIEADNVRIQVGLFLAYVHRRLCTNCR